jgi:hypothetical protein
VFAWEALTTWAQDPASATLLGKIVAIQGRTLAEWLQEFSPGYSGASVALAWFSNWGVDLGQLTSDRDIRNVASYQPTALRRRASLDARQTAEALLGIWAVFEPSSNNGFEGLDRHLLRLAFEDAYTKLPQQSKKSEPFPDRVARAVGQLGFTEPLARLLTEFLVRQTDGDDPFLINESRKTDLIGTLGQHLQVIARAALLLRAATGATAKLLQDAGISRSDLAFWWTPLVDDAGLSDSAGSMTDPFAMWADVELALESVASWIQTLGPSDSGTKRDLVQQRADALIALSGCERVGIWGLI